MEAYLKSVWDDVLSDIKDSIDDPESRAALKEIMTTAMIKNRGKLPAVQKSSGIDMDSIKLKTKIDTGKGTTVSAYNLHWNHWKEENPVTEYTDPDDDSKKLTAHKYWQKHIWPNLEKSEKEEWEEKAKKARSEMKSTSSGTKAKRKVSKSGFQLFLEKMKSLMDKDEEFTHPENGQTVKTHHYLIYVWSNHVKNNDDLKQPFEDKAQEIKDSEDGQYDLEDLPYLDPDDLRAGNLDDLDLVEPGTE